MSDIVDQSLRKITWGAILVFIGTAIAMLFGMVNRVIIIRNIDQAEYGIYALATTIVNVVTIISLLGMQTGLSRQIAFYMSKHDETRVGGLIYSSVRIGLTAGLIFSLFLFAGSELIAIKLFHNSALVFPLKILCILIPLDVLILILTAIFRGFNKAEPSVYFDNISRNGLFLLFLIPVISFLNFRFSGVIYALIASHAVTLVIYVVYTIRKLPVPIKSKGKEQKAISKDILFFSLPLLAVAMSQTIATHTDTLMLGYYMTSSDVGLYNAALPLAHVIPITLGALGFLALPLMSQLYAKDQVEDIRKIYTSLTKWIFSTSLPFFLVLALFPVATLKVLFGYSYTGAASAMTILSIGFFVHAILGPNGNMLVVLGRTKFYMWMVLLSLSTNIVLNAVLIPIWGINGAAVATTSTLILRNVLLSTKLYFLARINPFTPNFLKPAVSSIVLAFGIQWLVKSLLDNILLWHLPLFFVLFLILYALCVIVTRSFDNEDIMMITTVEKRSGIKLTAVKRILEKFR